MKTKHFWLALVAVTTLGLPFGAQILGIASNAFFTTAQAQNTQDTTSQQESSVLRTIIAGLEARESAVTTASGYFAKEVYNNSAPEVVGAFEDKDMREVLQQPPALTHLFWVADGLKVREDQKSVNSKQFGSYELKAFDGERVQAWGWGEPTATEVDGERIGVGGTATWLQLLLGKDAKPLSQQLKERQLRYLGQEKVLGEDTYKIEAAPKAGGRDIDVWWIAPAKSSLVMKHERRPKEPLDNGPIRSYRVVDVVDKVSRVGENLWIPPAVRRVSFLTLRSNPNQEIWQTMFRFSVLSLKVNEPISPGTFELPLPLGTRVGGKGRETYIVGGDIDAFEERVKAGQPDAKALSDAPLDTPENKTP